MAAEISSYLKRLTFNPRLQEGVFAALLTNVRITLLLVIGILVLGTFALISLPRRINPEVNIPIVFVSTIFPGASPEDVEELVTIPLEDAITGIEGISRLSSSSQENISTIVVEFSSRIDTDTATSDVQQAVDAVSDLPQDSQTPNVQALDFEDVPVLQFAIVGRTDPVSLNKFASDLEAQLEDLPQVQRVGSVGLNETQVEILIDPATYATYQVSPLELQQVISSAIRTFPVGSVRSNGNQMAVAIELPGSSLEVLRTLPLTIGNTQLVLGEIAAITLKANPDLAPSYFNSGEGTKQAVSLSAYKTLSADLEDSALAAREVVTQAVEQAGGQYEAKIVMDFAKDIDDQFGDLVTDFATSIALVFLTLLLFIGIRQAALASFVIPLSFLSTFAAMYFFDIQLSFLSLFSLLLGLGMIVDDAIVMISAMTDYFASGKFTPKQTALLVWDDFKSPTLSSNLTNIWSFLPLLIATGIIGEFTKVISIVVTVTLVTSTIISLFVTIPLMTVVLRPRLPKRVIAAIAVTFFVGTSGLLIALMTGNKLVGFIILIYLLLIATGWTVKRELWHTIELRVLDRSIKWFKKHQLKDKILYGTFSAKGPIKQYKQYLLHVLQSKRSKRFIISGVIGLALFSYLLVPLGFVEQEFFPSVDQDTLYVSLKLPIGTAREVTEAEALEILNTLGTYETIDYTLLDVGASADFSSASQQNQSNLARFSISLIEERDMTSIEFAQQLRQDFATYTTGELNVVEQSAGPPAGADVQITLLGDDLAKLQTYSSQVEAYLKANEEVTNVALSVEPGLSKIVFEPDLRKLQEFRLNAAQVAATVRIFLSDLDLGEIRVGEGNCREDCHILLRLNEQDLTAEELGKVTIPSPTGEMVALSSLGHFVLKESPTVVNRLDGQRSITISGAVVAGANQVEIGKQLETYVDSEMNLPDDISWQTGGVNEENQRSVNSILQAMLISAILIMGTMVVELKSFRRAFIVMLVIPLAISGVFIVFAVFGIPLSFPALIGVLALFGIVVKNAILIVDKINLNRDIGLPYDEAIADGASSRLEPIIFSSATNIIGLLPITLSDPLWRGLGGAIIAGLTLSGMIMLFFIPLVYHSWFKPRSV